MGDEDPPPAVWFPAWLVDVVFPPVALLVDVAFPEVWLSRGSPVPSGTTSVSVALPPVVSVIGIPPVVSLPLGGTQVPAG